MIALRTDRIFQWLCLISAMIAGLLMLGFLCNCH